MSGAGQALGVNLDKRANVDALDAIAAKAREYFKTGQEWAAFWATWNPSRAEYGPKSDALAAAWNAKKREWETAWQVMADWLDGAKQIIELGVSNLEQLAVKLPPDATPEEVARASALADVGQAYAPHLRAALSGVKDVAGSLDLQVERALAAQARTLDAMPGDEEKRKVTPIDEALGAAIKAAGAGAGIGFILLGLGALALLASFRRK